MELRGFYWNLPFNKNRIFSIKIFPGHIIKYARKGDIAEIIYKNEILIKYKKSFEYSSFQLFSTLLERGSIILDVGANSGVYSIFYSRLVGDKGRIYAFEPDTSNYFLLQENLKLNNCNNVRAYNFALSNKESIVEMISYNPADLNLKLQGDSFKYMKEVSDITEPLHRTKAYKLDDLDEIKNISKIDFIKIDVEGAELLVLQGSINTIKKHKPVIIFELLGEWTIRFNYRPYEVLILLNELNYEMEEYDFQQWIARPIK